MSVPNPCRLVPRQRPGAGETTDQTPEEGNQMARICRGTGAHVAALLCALTMMAPGAAAQDGTPATTEASQSERPSVRFSFTDANLKQVLDFFARESGLPIIFEVDAPDQRVTFISPEAYAFDEALRVLNTILQTKGVFLRFDERFLYLQKLDNMKAESVPTFADGVIPDSVSDEMVISVLKALENATAVRIAEQLRPLIAPYGAIVALADQNQLLITETAGACRRMIMLIERLDSEPAFEESIRTFKIKHLPANDVMESIKVLVAERQRTVFIDESGNRRELAKDELVGVRMQSDARTNTIIALGPEGRLTTVASLIELIDVPDSEVGQSRVMRTFMVDTMQPSQAKRVVEAMYASLPENQRPTLVPLDPAGKLTVLGSEAEVERVGVVLAELEGRAPESLEGGDDASRALVVTLENSDASGAIDAVRRLLVPRQVRMVRMAATPDGKGVLVSGAPADVEAARSLLAAVDEATPSSREVRVLEFERALTGDRIDEAWAVLRAVDPSIEESDLLLRVSAGARSLSVIGIGTDIEAFAGALRSAMDAETGLVETRSFALERTAPSKLAQELVKLSEPLLRAEGLDGLARVRAEGVDALDVLIVTASPDQFRVLAPLVARLDTETTTDVQVRVVDLGDVDAEAVAARAASLLEATGASLRPAERGELTLEVDEATGKLVVTGDSRGLQRFDAILDEALDLTPRTSVASMAPPRLLPLRTADADAIARTLTEQYSARPPEERREKPLRIRADQATNTLIVSAHPEVLEEIVSIVSDLNQSPTIDDEDREIRIFPLRIARAEELARTLDEMFPQPPAPLDRRGNPIAQLRPQREVIVRADGQTNSLIVDAPSKRMSGFEELVKQLDRAELGGDIELRMFRVERADPSQIASTLRDLAQSGSLVSSSSDAGSVPVRIDLAAETRTLIVTGPVQAFDRVEELLATLDVSDGAPETVMNFYALTSARAADAAPVLQRVLDSRVRAVLERDGLDASMAQRLLEVVPDAASNTLIVTVPGELESVARELVGRLDAGGVAGPEVVRVLTLTDAKASDVARTLRETVNNRALPSGGQVRISPSESSNAVVISGALRDVEFVQGIAGELDRPAKSEKLAVRSVVLKHARAERVAPLVQRLLQADQMDSWMRYQLRVRNQDQNVEVRAEADARTNTVIITGPPEVMPVAEEMIARLDVPAGSGAMADVRPLRVIPLRNASAQAIATNLQTLFAQDASGDAPPTMRVDTEANALLVRATLGQLVEIERVVAELEGATLGGGRELRRFTVDPSRTDARELARTLERLLRDRGGMRVEVIDADALIKPEADADGPVEDPDDEGIDETRSKILLPRRTRMILNFVQVVTVMSQQAEADTEAEREPDVTIAVDPETNAIILIGSSRATQRAAELLGLLQDQFPAQPGKVRIVNLPDGVPAWTVANTVNATTQRLGRLSDRNPGGLTGNVSVVADPRGGALVVASNDTDFETIGPLIGALAQPGDAREVAVRVYDISAVDANGAIRSVRDLMSPPGVRAGELVTVSLPGEDGAEDREVTFRAGSIRVSAGPSGASLIVAGPPEAMPLVDTFVSRLDESQPFATGMIRRYELENAQADQLARTLRDLFNGAQRAAPRNSTRQASFIADERTNALLVAASDDQHAEVERLLATLDTAEGDEDATTKIFRMRDADADSVARVLERVLGGEGDPKVRVTPERSLGLLIVRAPEETMERAEALVAELDTPATEAYESVSIKLERADANEVARALQRFFDDRSRATSRPGQRSQRRVSIVGDRRTSTLLVAASTEDLEEVRSLIADFDAPAEARDLQFRVYELTNAQVSEVLPTVQDLAQELRWSGIGGDWDQGLIVRGNTRTNSIVALGRGESFEQLDAIVERLDVAASEGTVPSVRVFKIANADLRVLRTAAEAAFSDPGASQRWWEPQDPTTPRFEIDENARSLIVIAPESKMEDIAELVALLDTESGATQVVRTVQLTFADANQAAASLSRFFRDRARQAGLRNAQVTVIGSRAGNALIFSGPEDEMALAEDIASKLDSPEASDDQLIEVFVLEHGSAREVARSITDLFPRRGRSDSRVTAVPDSRTNAVIVSAPKETLPQVTALIEQLDEFPESEAVAIRTFSLTTARADEVAETLRSALRLDETASGQARNMQSTVRRFVNDAGEPIEVRAEITAERRSNTVLVTADDASMSLIAQLIDELDEQPTVMETEYRVIPLEHVLATDVSATLRTLVGRRAARDGTPPPNITSSRTDNTLLISATGDQFEEIINILKELDTPGRDRRETEFVALEFADAEQVRRALGVFYGRFASAADTPGARNVNIVADTATNSLVISAEPEEWEGIRALIVKLDAEEYDASRRLEVIALQHADAPSVAEAINRAFEAPLRNELDRERREREERNNRNRDNEFQSLFPVPDVLVEQEEFVSVSAEPITNTLIVSATKRNLERVRSIVERIDVPEFAALEPPRVIVLPAEARPSVVAQALSRMYQNATGRRGAQVRNAVRIVGDDDSGTLLVRADDDTFAEIRSLAMALSSESERGAVTTRVLPVIGQPAVRLRDTLRATFQTTAAQRQEPFSVEVDRRSNALIVAASEDLFDEMRRVVEELNAAAGDDPPGEGEGEVPFNGAVGAQRLIIVQLENTEPQRLIDSANRLGLTRPSSPDRPGVLAEPITLTPLTSQRAVAVLVSPGDAPAAEAILRTLDSQPNEQNTTQISAIIPLSVARAQDVVQTVERLLDAESSGARTGVARSLTEQVRRLRLQSDSAFDTDLDIDLTRPIRVIAQPEANAVLIASSEDNVEALRELVTLLDKLPQGDAVVIRMFHLEHASASRAATILRDLFQAGESLRRTPGTQLRTVPTTETGKALIGEIAISTDERTNALIVAGREEAVALAEVLVGELDAERANEWVEPKLVALRYADADDVAQTVRRVLVEGVEDGPGAEGLRRQVARLRVMREKESGGVEAVESEIFVPMSRLLVIPENNLNALVITGTPANVRVVTELVALLDVKGASRLGSLRFFPLEHAAADRVADLLRSVFQDQRSIGAIREEDELIVNADLRTNALIVSTSPRSFAVVEALVRALDVEEASSTVGLHVVRVPRGDVRRLAQRIESVMADRLRALEREGSSRRDVISIEPDEASRSLIVASSDENLEMIQQLVEVLSGDEVAGGEELDIIPVTKGKASDIVPLLNELYVRDAVRSRGDGSVRVSADARLNAVVVAGTDQDVQAIRELVERLDTATLSSVREIKIVEMTSANALEMVNLLQNVLSGRSLAGRNIDAQATLLRFVKQRAAEELGIDPDEIDLTETEVSSAIRERVSLTPDLRTNSIVVSAPPAMMVMIESMIETLDTSASGSRDIRVFALENADADNMAELLRDLFNLQRQGNLYILVPTAQPDLADGISSSGDGLNMGDVTLSVVPDERQALSITIDARTNSLLVSGTPLYLELVSGVVEQLDAKTGTERERFAVELKNAEADEVASALQSFIDQEQDRVEQALGPDREGSVIRRLEREISVVGVPGSNRLLVSVSPRYRQVVQDLIDELDRPPAQVLIQVLLAEVTLDSEQSFGIDFTLNPLGSRQAGGSYRSGGTGVLTAIGVPNISVSSLDFELLVRALEVQGRLEVLSRPQILVNDNESAMIQVGEEIQLVTDVERLDNGNVRSDVTPRDLGVVLTVEPSISPDGFVRLQIAPEISALTTRTTQVSEDFSAPVISTRRADTTVTVKDGQTIVIGGLIQTGSERRVNKVPILGDIPILGIPFRSERVTNTKTELLIILTPRVIFTDNDTYNSEMRAITDDEVDRLTLPENIRDSLRENTVYDIESDVFDEVNVQNGKDKDVKTETESGEAGGDG